MCPSKAVFFSLLPLSYLSSNAFVPGERRRAVNYKPANDLNNTERGHYREEKKASKIPCDPFWAFITIPQNIQFDIKETERACALKKTSVNLRSRAARR